MTRIKAGAEVGAWLYKPDTTCVFTMIDSYGNAWNGDAVNIWFTKPVNGVPTYYSVGRFTFTMKSFWEGFSQLHSYIYSDSGWENSNSKQTRTFHPVEYNQMEVVGMGAEQLVTETDIRLVQGCPPWGSETMAILYHRIYAFDQRFSMHVKFMEDVGTGPYRVETGDFMTLSKASNGYNSPWLNIFGIPNNATVHFRFCPDNYRVPNDMDSKCTAEIPLTPYCSSAPMPTTQRVNIRLGDPAEEELKELNKMTKKQRTDRIKLQSWYNRP